MSVGFGSRARVGHLYPSGGICDYEIQLMAPEGVQFVTTRVPFRRTGLADDLRFAELAVAQCDLLADAQVDLIAVNCTAATMLAGPERIRRLVLERTGISAVTTIEAVLAALAALEASRIALVTPYVEEVVDAEVDYLRERGIHVVRRAGRPWDTPVEQGEVPPEEWLAIARAVPTEDLDAILISCAGVQIASVIEQIEQATSCPVITSNQALLWWVLRELGISDPIPGYGQLLATMP